MHYKKQLTCGLTYTLTVSAQEAVQGYQKKTSVCSIYSRKSPLVLSIQSSLQATFHFFSLGSVGKCAGLGPQTALCNNTGIPNNGKSNKRLLPTYQNMHNVFIAILQATDIHQYTRRPNKTDNNMTIDAHDVCLRPQ